METRSIKETGNISFDMQKKYEIVDLLIKEDANINTTKNFKNEILFYTIMKITIANIELLENSDKKNDQINSSINLFRLIVSTGVNLNSMSIEVKGKSVNLIDFSIIKNAHNYRVTYYAVALAEAMGMPSKEIADLIVGAFLHDVGKIGIPDSILNYLPNHFQPYVLNPY